MRISDWSSDVCSSDLEPKRASVNRQHECEMSQQFNGQRGCFTAANAQCRDAAAQAALLHGMDQGDHQPCTGGANRLAQRAGAALYIEFGVIDTQLANRSARQVLL